MRDQILRLRAVAGLVGVRQLSRQHAYAGNERCTPCDVCDATSYVNNLAHFILARFIAETERRASGCRMQQSACSPGPFVAASRQQEVDFGSVRAVSTLQTAIVVVISLALGTCAVRARLPNASSRPSE